ncbi:hypothetical protein HPB47_008548 [Ixodes persulcatus]|uniref:Uncharacterized protein n=1 Tax=Ixodes persulcatus TaxID=34615 RepID=A0AC60P4X0_IXOPE|nr:hypothetical protein HPB47_008548 [Ixodes persulcatus]
MPHGNHTREGAVQTSERLFMAQAKVSESYQTVKCALIRLHERYEASKPERNIVRRYALFKASILRSVLAHECCANKGTRA